MNVACATGVIGTLTQVFGQARDTCEEKKQIINAVRHVIVRFAPPLRVPTTNDLRQLLSVNSSHGKAQVWHILTSYYIKINASELQRMRAIHTRVSEKLSSFCRWRIWRNWTCRVVGRVRLNLRVDSENVYGGTNVSRKKAYFRCSRIILSQSVWLTLEPCSFRFVSPKFGPNEFVLFTSGNVSM